MAPQKRKRWQQQAWSAIFPGKKDREFLRTFEKKKWGVWQSFLVSHKKDGEWHTHLIIALQRKPCFTSPKALEKYFGTTQTMPLDIGKGLLEKLNVSYNYCTDQKRHPGQIISDPILDDKFQPGRTYAKSPSKKKLSLGQQIFKQCVEENKTLPELIQEADWPTKYYIAKNMEELKKTISNYRKLMVEAPAPKYQFKDFKDTEVKKTIMEHSFAKPPELGVKPKVLVVQGFKSDLGKTQIAKAKFKRPLTVRHVDKLKELDTGYHDGIVFDDMSFAHWPRESVIALFDLEEDADINVKCSMVTIPAGFPRIFTTNRSLRATTGEPFTVDNVFVSDYDKETSFLPAKLGDKDTAIEVRMKKVTVEERLF